MNNVYHNTIDTVNRNRGTHIKSICKKMVDTFQV